eukprot:gene6509-4688_t
MHLRGIRLAAGVRPGREFVSASPSSNERRLIYFPFPLCHYYTHLIYIYIYIYYFIFFYLPTPDTSTQRRHQPPSDAELTRRIREGLQRRATCQRERKNERNRLWGAGAECRSTPEDKANLFQQLYYGWVSSYIARIARGECTEKDLPPPTVANTTYHTGKALSAQVDQDIEDSRRWEPFIGCRVRFQSEYETLGYLRWVGYIRPSDYPHDLVAGIEWSVPPRKRREALEAGEALALHNGVVHGERLFQPLFHKTNMCSCEPTKSVRLLPPVGVTPPPPPAAPDILWSLAKSHAPHVVKQVPAKLVSDLCAVALPVLLQRYVMYISSSQTTWLGGLTLVFFVFILSAVQSCSSHKYDHISIRAAAVFENAATAVVFEKCLKVSGRFLLLPEMSLGRLMNMITSDVDAIGSLNWYIMYFWSAPLQLILCMYLLFGLVGWSALCGVAVLLLTLPLQGVLSKKSQDIREQLAVVVDTRIRRTNEFLSASRIVKFMGWEPRFMAAIEKVRDQEISMLRRMLHYDVLFMTVDGATPILVISVVLVMFYITGHALTPGIVFPTIALLNTMRIPFFMIPVIMSAIIQCFVSTRRLTTFLECDDGVSQVRAVDTLFASGVKAALNDADVRTYMPVALPTCKSRTTGSIRRLMLWLRPRKMPELEFSAQDSAAEVSSPVFEGSPASQRDDFPTPHEEAVDDGSQLHQLLPKVLLHGVNLIIPEGQLTVVIGETGCGKTTLVLSIIGAYETARGEVWATKSIAYVPQQPWIMNATVRENVLFFSEERDELLREALRVSQLETDLGLMANGLETEIGEKGINLSGGQKARVSLARAVYADREMYLLDDPLSALDAHVGEKVVRECILGKLAGRTRVLATHHMHVLKHADHVIVLKKGSIEFSGSYSHYGRWKEETHYPEDKNEVQHADPALLTSRGVSEDGAVKERAAAAEAETASPAGDAESSPAGPEAEAGANGQLMTEEEKAVGDITWETYKGYFTACGGLASLVATLAMFLATECVSLGTGIWLSIWSTRTYQLADSTYLYVYLLLVFLSVFCSPIRGAVCYRLGLRASKALHGMLLASVSTGTMQFYDSTPLGRILNRFTHDLEIIDMTINDNFLYLPIILIVVVPAAWIYRALLVIYKATNRETRRIRNIAMSPVFSLLESALHGQQTIALYGKGPVILQKAQERMDALYSARYMENIVNRWLGVRLEFISCLITTIVALSGVLCVQLSLRWLNVGLISLSLTMSLTLTESLNWFVRQMASVEASMSSVERIFYYVNEIDHEDLPHIRDVEAAMRRENQHHAPVVVSAGSLEFRNVQMRYREGLPLVLRDVTFCIAPREKVGVVGRTGSGKSTLMLTFMRMVDICGGEILVNGSGIRTYPLRELRKQFSMIPQDPVLFDGTVRQNLDPFQESSAEEVWEALTLCGLRERVESETGGLDGRVLEGGSNFSVGQRQLLCMARALLRKGSGFILMDEATANIDPTLDRYIQSTVMNAFAEYTVITIAHRLHTVANYDKIIVMDQGVVAETGTPRELVSNRQSIFRSMVEALGADGAKEFMKLLSSEAE